MVVLVNFKILMHLLKRIELLFQSIVPNRWKANFEKFINFQFATPIPQLLNFNLSLKMLFIKYEALKFILLGTEIQLNLKAQLYHLEFF